MKITDIDKNFAANTAFDASAVEFYDPRKAPLTLYGVQYENGKYRRMPEAAAKAVSEGVHLLHDMTAGGRVRFVTNSEYFVITCKLTNVSKMTHMPFNGSCGFDFYQGADFGGMFTVPYGIDDNGYTEVRHTGRTDERVITVNFPSYSGVREVFIGVDKNAVVKEAPAYKTEGQVVYYGSSITQGGCSSRPGTLYQGTISRRFDMDYVNLGFSGNGKGEPAMAEYIASLPMRAFVLDYDHNAATAEHLKATHEPFFLTVREKHPTVPVIMVSSPTPCYPDQKVRRDIIAATCENARARGDKNVYFIDGLSMIPSTDGSTDGVHPNDLGFYFMAKAIGDMLEKALAL